MWQAMSDQCPMFQDDIPSKIVQMDVYEKIIILF